MSLALLMISASYVQPEPVKVEPVKVEPVKVTTPKQSKGRAKSNGDQAAAPIANGTTGKVTMPGILLPDLGTLSAADFLVAVRNAGKRKSPEGKPIFDRSVERDDVIKAIAGFIGWDSKESYSSNLLRANSEAKRQLSPIANASSLPAHRRGSAAPTVAGFVSGLPDLQSKEIARLQAAAVVATEAMIAWSKVRSLDSMVRAIRDHFNAGGSAEAEAASKETMIAAVSKEPLATIISTAAEMAMVERQRLDQIQADLAKLGVS